MGLIFILWEISYFGFQPTPIGKVPEEGTIDLREPSRKVSLHTLFRCGSLFGHLGNVPRIGSIRCLGFPAERSVRGETSVSLVQLRVLYLQSKSGLYR